jgi:hypothetical protein
MEKEKYSKEEKMKKAEEEIKIEKKAEKNAEEGKKGPKEEKAKIDYSKQTKYILLTMGIMIIATVFTYAIIQREKAITYHGIEFYKENNTGIMYYNSLFGYATATGDTIPFILQLRINPEELEKIPANANITLLDDAIISLSPEVLDCKDTYITVLDLSMILKAFGTYANGATTDEELAKEENVSVIGCKDSLNQTVIIFQEGNKTQITQDKEFSTNCYIIEVNDCEVRKGYEKFILHYVENSMERYD